MEPPPVSPPGAPTEQQSLPPSYSPPTLPYGLITALSAVGAAETAYLAYEKLTGGQVECPLGGCSDVLNSAWGTLFGLPLALYGCAAYGAIGLLAQAARVTGGSGGPAEAPARWLLLAASTGAATVSGYLLYILGSQFEGTTCFFCLTSAFLSTSIFVCVLRGFAWFELLRALAPQAAFSASVLIALNIVFADARSALAGPVEIDLPPIEPAVTTTSAAGTVSLAKHLKAIGAKMYGAFWCSHCYEQKQMFGQEAIKYVPYVECYPEGYYRGVTLDKQCDEANIQGFPTWVVKGQMLAGEQELDALARAAGFDSSKAAK